MYRLRLGSCFNTLPTWVVTHTTKYHTMCPPKSIYLDMLQWITTKKRGSRHLVFSHTWLIYGFSPGLAVTLWHKENWITFPIWHPSELNGQDDNYRTSLDAMNLESNRCTKILKNKDPMPSKSQLNVAYQVMVEVYSEPMLYGARSLNLFTGQNVVSSVCAPQIMETNFQFEQRFIKNQC